MRLLPGDVFQGSPEREECSIAQQSDLLGIASMLLRQGTEVTVGGRGDARRVGWLATRGGSDGRQSRSSFPTVGGASDVLP
jgi:hypothetical protein